MILTSRQANTEARTPPATVNTNPMSNQGPPNPAITAAAAEPSNESRMLRRRGEGVAFLEAATGDTVGSLVWRSWCPGQALRRGVPRWGTWNTAGSLQEMASDCQPDAGQHRNRRIHDSLPRQHRGPVRKEVDNHGQVPADQSGTCDQRSLPQYQQPDGPRWLHWISSDLNGAMRFPRQHRHDHSEPE